ncbi:tripartite tricarboxylate transporter permease [Falsiroseomonas oryzae]|uniref:tripartite tricarboxylate transporter permease n=1 Tax=Falsiroseomonas oryzae TaxID=2766473 RepID=UPI0022EA44B0|nr:tripartite tricarboxylate transporter permease [Roseomonas sp. MO-31]
MEVLPGLATGFAIALEPGNLLIALVGAVLGTAVGVLPGLGPSATISLLLPVSVLLDRNAALILLAGIYYGAMYGGSITSILVRIPGEAASVVTCLDGHAMARNGRAGAALGLSAIGSFVAGILATCGIVLLGPWVAQEALAFGPVERAALLVFGLTLVAQVGEGSRPRAWTMVGAGLLLSTTGTDLVSGIERFTFDVPELRDGISIAVMAMGLFGVSEVLLLAASRDATAGRIIPHGERLRDLLPNRQEWRESGGAIVRGSGLGFVLGLLPGGGALIASFASYILEKRISRTPERFGHGAPAGVAGPESANNAAAQASFVPLLALGIPANAVIGIIMGALLMQGVVPGPRLALEHPELFWSVIASMFVGNLVLLALNLPLVGLFVALLRVPSAIMGPFILLFCAIGAYSLNNSMMDVWLMAGFGVVGFLLRRHGWDPAPLLLAFVLGSMLEQSLRQGLLVGYGSPMVFLQKPISAASLAAAALVLLLPLALRAWRGAPPKGTP